jgi:hypothetical protein
MEKELLQLFLTTPVPEEVEAGERSWRVVRAAYDEREPIRRPARRLAPALAFAALAAAVVAIAVSPVGSWINDRIQGEEDAQPALFRIPAPGQLLVLSRRGPWVVRPDGSKRLLGGYESASFSPRGKFVVVTRGRRVTAVEPDGDPRWSITRPEMVAQARWAPSGFRVAYRAGETLRVVVGDGTADRLLARGVAPVAPAWRPRPAAENVLAYVDRKQTVRVVDVDTREVLWRTKAGARVTQLLWARSSLLVVTRSGGVLYDQRHRTVLRIQLPKGHVLLDADFGPSGEGLAYTDFDTMSQETAVVRNPCAGAAGPCLAIGPHAVFRGTGRLQDVAWSPDGRWLLATWPDLDQFLFLRLSRVHRILPVSGITREFDPGGEGAGAFPRVAGWCTCPSGA